MQNEIGTFPENMPAATTPSKASLWAGRVMWTLGILFLSFDAAIKLMRSAEALDGTLELGYPATVVLPLGILQILLLGIYVYPRTAILGAVLWTGYLGGAIATHVRMENPLFSHVLFPVYVAVLLWGPLWLRSPRLRALFPLVR